MPKRVETCAVLNDIHIPFEDASLLNAVLKALSDIKPEVIILNGDIMDCFAISRFQKSLEADEGSFAAELREGRKFLAKLRGENPNADIIYVEGNHEFRLQKLMDELGMKERSKYDWLPSLVSMSKLLKLDEYNIYYVSGNGEAWVEYGNTIIGHFNRANKRAGATGNNLLLDKTGQNTVQGHIHRAAVVHKTLGKNHHWWAVENPCITKTQDAGYVNMPDWQQGFLILKRDTKTDAVFPHLVVVDRTTRTFEWNDKIYSCGKEEVPERFVVGVDETKSAEKARAGARAYA